MLFWQSRRSLAAGRCGSLDTCAAALLFSVSGCCRSGWATATTARRRSDAGERPALHAAQLVGGVDGPARQTCCRSRLQRTGLGFNAQELREMMTMYRDSRSRRQGTAKQGHAAHGGLSTVWRACVIFIFHSGGLSTGLLQFICALKTLRSPFTMTAVVLHVCVWQLCGRALLLARHAAGFRLIAAYLVQNTCACLESPQCWQAQ